MYSCNYCCHKRCCECCCPPIEYLEAYGGACFCSFNETTLSLPVSPSPGIALPLNSIITPLINVLSTPANSITLKVAGTYEIYFYLSGIPNVDVPIEFGVSTNGQHSATVRKHMNQSSGTYISGTATSTHNAGDVISTILFSFEPVNLTLSPGCSVILYVKKLNT